MNSNDKTNGASGDLGAEEETTPALPRREPSAEATALRNLGIALNSVEQHCRESAHVVDDLEGEKRRHALASLADTLGELGELAFDARRIVRGIAGLTSR